MTPRERMLAFVLLVVVLLGGGGFMFHQAFLEPYQQRQGNLDRLRQQADDKQKRVNDILAEQAQLNRWRQLSLPGDADVARTLYERYLNELLRTSGFAQVTLTARPPDSRNAPALPDKKPIYTRLAYNATGRATLDGLVKMMEKFYRTGLLHQIKNLSVQRPATLLGDQRRDELDITLTVEALVVTGVDKRPQLMPTLDRRSGAVDVVSALCGLPTRLGSLAWAVGPAGPGGPGLLADPPRDYAAIAQKNIFFGPATPQAAPPAPTDPRYELPNVAFLTSITIDFGRTPPRAEAALYDRATNRKERLRTSPGYNQFALVQSSQGATLVHAEVKRIDERELVFRVALNAHDPEDSAKGPYKDREVIYRLHKDDVENLARQGLVRSGDSDRLYHVDKGYWDFLVQDKVVNVSGDRFTFRWGLVRGQVVRSDNAAVVLRLDERYCAYAADPEQDRRPRLHEGYCRFHVGQSLAEALASPLRESELKGMKAAVAPGR